MDSGVGNIRALLDGAGIQLSEAATELRHYRDRIDIDPGRLQTMNERLTAIHDTARKHQVESRALPALHQRLREEIAELEGSSARLTELQVALQDLLHAYAGGAAQLHEGRVHAAEKLSAAISENIRALGMPQGRLRIDVEADFDAQPART